VGPDGPQAGGHDGGRRTNEPFDRAAHLALYRRRYSADRSLYLPHRASPPIGNMEGVVAHYPPDREAEMVRRAAETDARKYLARVAAAATQGATSEAEQVQRIAGYVHHTLYYNPIQVPATRDPVAILEAHDARCGQGVAVTVALLEALDIPVRAVPLFHHSVAEATYDGGAHVVDALFFGAHQPARDGRVLSVAELQADPYFADGFAQECFA
jgi:transglutaminase-like putative cysteine protease